MPRPERRSLQRRRLSGCRRRRPSLTLLLAAFAVGCGSGARPAPPLPAGDADLSGTLAEIHRRARPGEATVLLEIRPSAQGSGKALVTLTRATALFERGAGRLRRIGVEDLREGRRAAAWLDGPLLYSDPPQATARALVVERGGSPGESGRWRAARLPAAPDAAGPNTSKARPG